MMIARSGAAERESHVQVGFQTIRRLQQLCNVLRFR